MNRRPPLWYVIVAIAVSMLSVAGAGIAYTSHVQDRADARHDQLVRESERKWCALLDIITGGPAPAPGPAGDRARAIAVELAKLRRGFGC